MSVDFRKMELLSPAGDFEKMKIAFHYGADAVYLGLSDFSLRARAKNFTLEDLEEAVRYAHSVERKVYVTVNIIPHNRDLVAIQEHIQELNRIKPDAVILSDAGVFDMVKQDAPLVPIHISTQANISNQSSAKFWERMGASRIVLARELSIREIQEIRERVRLEIEAFVHGSLCIAYSGRCYMSSFMANRSANRGECSNSCRWNYTLMEEKRPGEHFPVYEDDRGTYVMSSRDLCMVEHLHALWDAGADSVKLEGRMKGINYTGGVVRVYREALDMMRHDGELSKEKREEWLSELRMFSNRGFTTGMYFGMQDKESYQHDEKALYRSEHSLVGVVGEKSKNTSQTSLPIDVTPVDLRNTLRAGDELYVLTRRGSIRKFKAASIYSPLGHLLDVARNGERVYIEFPFDVTPLDLIRKESLFDETASSRGHTVSS